MSHLGDKADFTPSPLKGSGSNRGCLTGETYDVVRSYGICSYRAGFSHPPYAPSKPLQPRRENGAERNRTAVRNTGVDHLVRSRTDLIILASKAIQRSTRRTTHAAMLLKNSIKGLQQAVLEAPDKPHLQTGQRPYPFLMQKEHQAEIHQP